MIGAIKLLFVIVAFIVMLSCNSNTDSDNNKQTNDTSGKTPSEEMKNDPIAYSKVLTFDKISFEITSTGKGSLQQVTIQPAGLSIDNRAITMEMEPIMSAEVGDLNNDRFPELLIYTQSVGSGSYGKLVGFSVNNGKSMSQISFPDISHNAKINKGYMGHDKFSIVNNQLTQEFPIYNEGDPNAQPTGKKRVITYKLKDGEASRIFEVDQVKEI